MKRQVLVLVATAFLLPLRGALVMGRLIEVAHIQTGGLLI
jgi:hypothetical protein